MVLDFCPGGEMFFHLQQRGKMIESVAKFYLSETLLAIRYLHDNDVMYRDLKPENVLLEADGHIRLTDFGLSVPNFTESSTSTEFCGSPEYMTPEMLMQRPYNR